MRFDGHLTSSERWLLNSDGGVGSLGLGTQAYNCVVGRAEILTIERLCHEDPRSLLRIRAMGPRWLAEVMVALGRRGRRLRNDGNVGAAVERYIRKIEPDSPNAPFSEAPMKHTPGPWNADSTYPIPGHMPGLHAPVICVRGQG